MKKIKGQSLEDLRKKTIVSREAKLAYQERRFYLQIAHLVSELRKKAGISQMELAKRAKVSQPQIARLEKGDQRRTPTFETISKTLRALGYSLEISIKPLSKAA